MSTERRPVISKTEGRKIDGIKLAVVIGHTDPTFGGALKVTLLSDQGNAIGEAPYVVRPAFPFFGNTGFEYQGNNLEDFNDTQKTYGMWFVPPDVGVTVMVVFIEGDPGQGFWIGCVPPTFAHRMVPAIGADTNYAISAADKKKYATSGPLPVAEINRRINGKNDRIIDEARIKKPVHPSADTYLTQGTLEDYTRGPTTTTSKRTPPNSVYGISTPGPLDRRPGAKKAFTGDTGNKTEFTVPVSRLGGTTIVMDDGDDRYQRKGPAGTVGEGEGYADTEAKEFGDPTIPKDEYFRIRTRTGHQLLMHNSEDLIYITNSRGTAWVELTSNGKIDIYAEDSISIHSKTDLNIYAGRDINMEAGRNVNIKASAEYSKLTPEDPKGQNKDLRGFESGRVYIESAHNFDLLIGRNGKIHLRNDDQTQGNLDIKVMGNMRLSVQDKDIRPTHTSIGTAADGFPRDTLDQTEEVKGLHIFSFENTRLETLKNLDLNTTGKNAFTAGDTTDILSVGNHTETAAQIHMNGPAARKAEISDIADGVLPLITHETLVTDGTLVWADTKYIKENTLKSIVKRIPMHEPWALHENFAPNAQTPTFTDREF